MSSKKPATSDAPIVSDEVVTGLPPKPPVKAVASGDAPPKSPPVPVKDKAPSEEPLVDRLYDAIISEPSDLTHVQVAVRQMDAQEAQLLLFRLESEEARKAFAAQDANLRPYRRALHLVAAKLASELDARYGLRKEFGPDEGHGAYVEAGPLGTLGAGAGYVHKRKTASGQTRSRHLGVGLYVRTGVITRQDITTNNRLAELARQARERATS